ncbi:hypothetical protein J7337_006480 [Fusarium musae]|uniref:ZZ-type domain-containing protein n=1 Tax=Fusarium musae TaxID=1042133 RepID=A0A9P8DF22_9HYPO|nr:hypothetical protein J7337_006480 [Fusarium musae]KAG9500800.1 hypothetical protein J7337_006480 [Fusarium musae]
MDTLIAYEALHWPSLFNEAERLQSIEGTPGDANIVSALSEFPSEYVRTIDHDPREPIPFPVEMEASMLMRELGECYREDLHQSILSALSSCAGDHDICGLVFDWLRSRKTQMPQITRLLDKPLTPALLFAELLEDVAEAHRNWARLLLSWLLVCYRPLKCDEFQRVSDTVWTRAVGSEAPQPSWAVIIESLHGLIIPVNGEMKFRHPLTRAWLESRHSVVGEAMWYDIYETDRHEIVLQTCIEYIQGAAENTENAALHLPYAIEFWPKHWQKVETSEKKMTDLFENNTVFEFWTKSLVGLKNKLSKPSPSHMKPLPIAAHLGLTAVVEALLRKHPDQAGLLGQALIEACRAGHAAVVRLLIRAYSNGLEFCDESLHEAARVAANSCSRETLRELVSGIPEPPKTASVRVGTGYKVEASFRSTENQEKNDQQANALDGALKGEQEAKGPKSEEHTPGPLDWLVMPMARAIRLGMEDVVGKLLQLGVDPNPPKGIIPYGNSFIYTAAATSNISCAKLLLEAGADQAARNDQGYTPLHTAIDWASGETVEFLLDHGANVEDEDPENRQALNRAASRGSFMALEVILQRRDEVDGVDYPSDRYPLNQAAESGHNKCVEILLRHGFSPNIVTSTGQTALISAIEAGRVDIFKMLLDNKVDPDLTPESSDPPLIQAISMSDLGMVKLLIEHGATVDKREAPPDEGWSRTPLNVAADWSKPEIFHYLLEKGADPNACDSDGIPVIGAAISGGHTNMVKWLIEANAELNVSYSDSKSTPLHEATAYPEIVRLLIQHGADINKVNDVSRTALNFAVSANHLATVQILLHESKTKPDLGTDTIQWDLRMVVGAGYTGVVEALLEAGADVNNVNDDGETLMISAIKSHTLPDMVRKVLEYNPDLELRDNKENTVLHHIKPTTNLETVRLIVNAGGKLNVSNSKEETPLFHAIRAQLDDVFFYMLRKEPGLLTGAATLSKHSGTPLHEACRAGTLSMVRSLIENQMDVNSSCQDIGINGTPLIAATLREDAASSGLSSEIIALLLVNGAVPTIPAGLFRYPLISACLSCPPDAIKLLLNPDASTLYQDSLNRRPVHLSCYNSLEVLNILDLPDSDFSATDVVGRVPLHYAVMRGDIELAQAVLERSKRAGVDVNVKDDDGWTPLLWAARTSPIWNHQRVDPGLVTGMVSFLLENGADINARGHGVDKDWTARDVAYYHHYEEQVFDFPLILKLTWIPFLSVDTLLHQTSAAIEENPPARKRGSFPESQGDDDLFCDCCLVENHGMHYKCSVCYDFSLCYKCHWSASKIHPDHSSFLPRGSEWFEDSTSEQEKISELGIDGDGGDGSVLLDREEVLYEDFYSEMSDEISEQ